MCTTKNTDRFIDLIRHGEVEGDPVLRGMTDTPLSLRGNTQMWQALSHQHPWQKVLTSPLQRCATFAKAIADHCKIPVTTDQRLQEINFGHWEGREISSILETDTALMTTFLKHPFTVTPPHGESPQAMKERVLLAWQEITHDLSWDNLLIITHGGPIRIILGEILSMPESALNKIEIPHANLTRIRIPTGGWPPSLMLHCH